MDGNFELTREARELIHENVVNELARNGGANFASRYYKTTELIVDLTINAIKELNELRENSRNAYKDLSFDNGMTNVMSLGEISRRMQRLKDWNLENNAIVKDFEFGDFKEAIAFVNKVGEIAEKNNHHPDIVINYNRVRLTLTTHEEAGLTSRDFDTAEEIDKVPL